VLSTLNQKVSSQTYTPDSSFVGLDSFLFNLNDGKADSNIANVSITVKGEQPCTSIFQQIDALKKQLATLQKQNQDSGNNGAELTLMIKDISRQISMKECTEKKNNRSTNINNTSTKSNTPPISDINSMNKNYFLVNFRGTTTEYRSDIMLTASTVGLFTLKMDSPRLVTGDYKGTVLGSGKVEIKAKDG
jgi:hypothetical protein